MSLPLSWDYLKNVAACKAFIPKIPRYEHNQIVYERYMKENNVLYDVESYFKDGNYVLMKNNFPYELDNNIEHYIIWLKNDADILNINIERLLNAKDYLVVKNPTNRMSIPVINHFHVFKRKIS